MAHFSFVKAFLSFWNEWAIKTMCASWQRMFVFALMFTNTITCSYLTFLKVFTYFNFVLLCLVLNNIVLYLKQHRTMYNVTETWYMQLFILSIGITLIVSLWVMTTNGAFQDMYICSAMAFCLYLNVWGVFSRCWNIFLKIFFLNIGCKFL